jgi:hypothetical protein
MSAGTVSRRLKGKPERTRKKAGSEARIQLDRYNNLFDSAFATSLAREIVARADAHAVRDDAAR